MYRTHAPQFVTAARVQYTGVPRPCPHATQYDTGAPGHEINWPALTDTYSVLVKHGDGHKPMWRTCGGGYSTWRSGGPTAGGDKFDACPCPHTAPDPQ